MPDLFLASGMPSTRLLVAMAMLYVLLAIASVGGRLATRPGHALRAQIDAWWLIFPVVSASLILAPHGPPLLLLLIGWLAWRELAVLCAPAARRRFTLACGLVLALQAVLTWRTPAGASAAMLFLLSVMAVRMLHRPSPERLLLLLFVLLGLGLSFVPLLLEAAIGAADLGWYFYLFAMTALNDIGQFVAGKCFGRHRIAARISPQKTWQGLAGGVASSLAASLARGLYLQLAGAALLAVLAPLLSLAGFAGDLLFSAAKRRLGIKDFSTLIPGHGGILDRVDSLVLTAPLLYLALAVSNT